MPVQYEAHLRKSGKITGPGQFQIQSMPNYIRADYVIDFKQFPNDPVTHIISSAVPNIKFIISTWVSNYKGYEAKYIGR